MDLNRFQRKSKQKKKKLRSRRKTENQALKTSTLVNTSRVQRQQLPQF